MTTSNTADWNPVLLFIIKQMLINCGVLQDDEEPTAPQYETGLFQLNAMVKTIEATGAHVWTEEEAILFLEPGRARYVIGGASGTAHTSDSEDWLELTLAQSAAAADTTITLATGQGLLLADGMNIGVVDNDGLTEWTTVSGAPVGDVVTLADALLVGVDAGNFALAYTTAIGRPLKVPFARLLTLQGLNETPMTVLSRQDYENLPQKLGSPGTPTQFFYSPRRDTGYLYVWPTPVTSAWAVRFTWYRPLQDFLVPTNTADFPQEWILPLIWNLSKENAPGYGVPEPAWQRIVSMADGYGLMVISYDRESEPVQFGMDYATGAPD